MTIDQKKNIDIIAPLAVAGLVAYKTYQAKPDDYKRVAVVALAVFVAVWLLSKAITRGLVANSSKPNDLQPLSDPGTSTAVGGVWDPTATTNALRQDCYGWGFRNKPLYATVASYSNGRLVAIYNDWNARFYSEKGETLVQAMEAENYGWDLWDTVAADARNIINRLKSLS